MTRKQIRAVLLAFVLVTTAIAGPMTGTVAAQAADTEECGTWDALLYDAFSIGDINLGGDEEENPCSAEYQVNQVTEEFNETDAAQTRVAIHARAGQLAATNEQLFTVQQNYLKDTETIAFSEGEAAAIEVLSNGGTISEAQQAANESIEDYYAVKQINLIDRWNVNVQTAHTLADRANNTTGVNSDFVHHNEPGNLLVSGVDSRSLSLVNGSNTLMDQFHVRLEYDSQTNTPYVDFLSREAEVDTATRFINQISVRPTDDLTSKEVVVFDDFSNEWNSIKNKSEGAKQEVSVYINDSLGPAVESGEYNATSYASASTLAREYAQEYNGSESYVQATALAASHGFSTPDLENTAHMTISHDGETYTGLLLSQEAPSSGWESNQVYDPALLSGIQLFAVSDAGANETGVVELDGSFSVESIQGTDGEQLEQANSTQIVYKTSNESADYSELQQTIRNLSAQIEQRENTIGGGGDGGGGGGGGSSNLVVGGVLIAGVALLVIGLREGS